MTFLRIQTTLILLQKFHLSRWKFNTHTVQVDKFLVFLFTSIIYLQTDYGADRSLLHTPSGTEVIRAINWILYASRLWHYDVVIPRDDTLLGKTVLWKGNTIQVVRLYTFPDL